MRVETHNKLTKAVDMVLYDGTEKCAKFINDWSKGLCFTEWEKGDLPDDDVFILFAGSRNTQTSVPKDYYVVKGSDTDFYPMAACDAHLFYNMNHFVGEATRIEAVNHVGTGMGYAIAWLKEGRRVRRRGWNGKGMWLAMMPELTLPPNSSKEPGPKVNDRTAKHIGEDTVMECQPYIVMWTAAQQWQPGWLPSQQDLLATDWEIVYGND